MDSRELRIRRVAIDTWRESLVYLHRECDDRIVPVDELGLSEDASVRLNVPAGHAVRVSPAEICARRPCAWPVA